jgi:hypothetical protein
VRRPRRFGWRLLALAALGCAAGPAAAAEPAAPPAPDDAGRPAPQVDLEDLLKLPGDVLYDMEKRGGATQGEWRSRFRKVRTDLAGERSALERAQLELEKVAGSSDTWKLAPPGVSANSSEAPLDYRLRNEIRQHRAEVDRLEKQLRDLEVEANLAGVPEEWRQ